MKIEKLFAYVFLTFILIVACFNIVGSLSMLIIDKKTMWSPSAISAPPTAR